MNVLQMIDRYLGRGTTDGTANTYAKDVIGSKADAAAAVAADKSLVAYAKQMLTQQATYGAMTRKCVLKADGALLDGVVDDLFTISGGPIYGRIFGVVTTVIGGATNGTLKIATTTPSASVALSTTVALDADAAGTLYTFTTVAAGTVPVLTPTTNGIGWYDPATATKLPAEFFLPPGTVQLLSSAVQTGVIAWYLDYIPFSPASVVVAAA